MRTRFLAFGLTVGLLLCGLASPPADAGKGGGGRSFSSGGRSFSSGSRSFSPSRPSSSSFGKSSTGSSRPSGKTYTAPSRPATPAPRTSAPPVRTSPSAGQKPSGSYDPSAGRAQQKQASREAYQSRTAPPPGPNPGVPHPGSPSANGRPTARTESTPSGQRHYGSGTGTPSGSGVTRPAGKSYDPAAAEAQRKEESRRAYVKATQPRPTYTDPTGTPRPIDPKDRTIESLRRQLDRERWANRPWRLRQFYGDYYYSQPVVVYHDPYNSWFWWWLLAQSLDTRAHWAYHHRYDMDEARYRDLLAKDAQLEARVKQLEAQNVPRDPTYHPQNLDPDLMYTDQYVEAVYNPVATRPAPSPSSGHALRTLLTIALIIAVLAFLVWLVFIKRWGGDVPTPRPAST
jgi:hypothetical protein